jgi:CheY-like chemotaxis protein
MIVSAEELVPKADPATVSHELRAPLNAIIGFSEALKDGLVGRLSDTQHEYVCDIFNSGQHLLSLIDGIDVNQATATMSDSAGAAVLAVVEPNKRIALVVDDDDRAADLLRLLLEAEGFTVIRAVSAEDALLLVPQQALGLITLDLEMYGINGWQFLQKLRESGTLAQVPVVIVSGRSVHTLARSRGAAAALQKPISRARLQAILADLGLLQGPPAPAR